MSLSPTEAREELARRDKDTGRQNSRRMGEGSPTTLNEMSGRFDRGRVPYTKPTQEAPPDVPVDGRGLARAASRGLGFGTNAGAAVTSGLAAGMAKLSGEEAPIGDIYRDIRGAESEEEAAFKASNPEAAAAAELGGSLLIPTGLLARGAGSLAKGGKNLLPASHRSAQAASRALPRATGATRNGTLPSAADAYRVVSRPKPRVTVPAVAAQPKPRVSVAAEAVKPRVTVGADGVVGKPRLTMSAQVGKPRARVAAEAVEEVAPRTASARLAPEGSSLAAARAELAEAVPGVARGADVTADMASKASRGAVGKIKDELTRMGLGAAAGELVDEPVIGAALASSKGTAMVKSALKSPLARALASRITKKVTGSGTAGNVAYQAMHPGNHRVARELKDVVVDALRKKPE